RKRPLLHSMVNEGDRFLSQITRHQTPSSCPDRPPVACRCSTRVRGRFVHPPTRKQPMTAPQFKQLRRAYGFDELANVPGQTTLNPELVEMGLTIGDHELDIPFLASAMDAVVDPSFAIEMHRHGGLASLNLEGIWTRYDDPTPILQEVASASRDESTKILQSA